MKKYDISEEESQMVKEDVALTYPSSGIVDAIWTLLLDQTTEVQVAIAERLNKLCHTSTLKPYTLEELNARIDESEQQMLCGDTVPGEQVHMRMRNIINSL